MYVTDWNLLVGLYWAQASKIFSMTILCFTDIRIKGENLCIPDLSAGGYAHDE